MTLGVVVTAIKRQISKRSGAEFARLTVEDFSGSAEVLVFPEAWAMLGRPGPDRRAGAAEGRLLAGATRTSTIRRSSSSRSTPFAEMRLNGQVAVAIDLATGAHSRRT